MGKLDVSCVAVRLAHLSSCIHVCLSDAWLLDHFRLLNNAALKKCSKLPEHVETQSSVSPLLLTAGRPARLSSDSSLRDARNLHLGGTFETCIQR